MEVRSRNRFALALVLGLTLAAVALTPATASAGKGWKLPKVTGQSNGNPTTSVAIHCGNSKFGTYTFRNGIKLNGRKGKAVFKVKLTANGRGHKAKLGSLRFTGDLPQRLRNRTRDLLESVKFHYVSGPPAVIETRRPNGTVQAQRAFNPRRIQKPSC
jgi:hypothetical protein